jgi:small subunit ribosomal protein S6
MAKYEGMFLVEPTIAQREWPKIVEEIERVVKKNGGTVVQLQKWGERKLSYPVRRHQRGTYVLAYFEGDGGGKAVTKMRADFQISEIVMRALILHHEGAMRNEPSRDFETAGPMVGGPRREGFPAGIR